MSRRNGYGGRAPRTLTEIEQRAVLRVTADHVRFRDHALLSLALGTGLRQRELLELDCGDLYDDEGRPRPRVRLRWYKGNGDNALQEAHVSEALRRKLTRLRSWKRKHGEPVEADSPVFVSRHGRRLSPQRTRSLWAEVQERAGLSQRYSFHELRHTAITNLYRRTRDLRLCQRYARHCSPDTTAIYAHVDDEALAEAVGALPC